MRNWINLFETGRYVPPPPEDDSEDEDHYDALDRTGFFGQQAAGCVFYARDTKRFLLMLRSPKVLESGHWGNCGGAHHADEQPIVAAEREGREETGYDGAMHLVPAFVFTSGSFRYSNFFAIVDHEFVPDLGWEATDYEWCNYGEWPSPLHFGLEALFADQSSVNTIKGLISE